MLKCNRVRKRVYNSKCIRKEERLKKKVVQKPTIFIANYGFKGHIQVMWLIEIHAPSKIVSQMHSRN